MDCSPDLRRDTANPLLPPSRLPAYSLRKPPPPPHPPLPPLSSRLSLLLLTLALSTNVYQLLYPATLPHYISTLHTTSHPNPFPNHSTPITYPTPLTVNPTFSIPPHHQTSSSTLPSSLPLSLTLTSHPHHFYSFSLPLRPPTTSPSLSAIIPPILLHPSNQHSIHTTPPIPPLALLPI